MNHISRQKKPFTCHCDGFPQKTVAIESRQDTNKSPLSMKIKQLTNNPFQENTYIIWDEQSHDAAIIDCGALFDGEKKAISGYITENNLNIIRLLNTHLHLDHCFGNHWAAETYGIKPEAHADDSPFIARFQEQLDAFGLPMRVPAEPLGCFLTDNVTIKIGSIELQVIHTPGHTPGSVCFYSRRDNMVLTGDTLFCGSVGRTDLEGGSSGDLVHSIKTRLLTLPDKTAVYCGHGPYTTIGEERKNNPFLQTHIL